MTTPGGPKYMMIAKDLQAQIESNKLRPGDRLPTESELASKWGVSPSTVKDALSELRKSGRVETRPREGTFVVEAKRPLRITLNNIDINTNADKKGAQPSPESRPGGGEGLAFINEAKRQGLSAESSIPKVEILEADRKQIEALKIPSDQESPQVVKRWQQRLVEGEPNSVQYSYFTLELAWKARRLMQNSDISEGTVAYLAGLGHSQVGYVDEFDARPPTPDERTFFGLSKDSLAVIEHSRTAYDQTGSPFRLTVTVYKPGLNKIRFIAGKVPSEVTQ